MVSTLFIEARVKNDDETGGAGSTTTSLSIWENEGRLLATQNLEGEYPVLRECDIVIQKKIDKKQLHLHIRIFWWAEEYSDYDVFKSKKADYGQGNGV